MSFRLSGSGFSIATTVSVRYDHNPLPGIEKTDVTTAISLVYKLLSARARSAPRTKNPAHEEGPSESQLVRTGSHWAGFGRRRRVSGRRHLSKATRPLQISRTSRTLCRAQLPLATLERTGCYGECPVYPPDGEQRRQRRVRRNALGEDAGQEAVQDHGCATRRAANGVRTRKFHAALHDYDRVENTDDDWALLSLYRGTSPKRVRHYHGDNSAPPALSALEDEFDRIVSSGRYVGMPSPSNSLSPSMSAVAPNSPADSAATPGKPAHSAENAGPPDDNAVADPDNHP